MNTAAAATRCAGRMTCPALECTVAASTDDGEARPHRGPVIVARRRQRIGHDSGLLPSLLWVEAISAVVASLIAR